MERLAVNKTWKMYVGGAFIRSEGGEVLPVYEASAKGKKKEPGAFVGNICRGTRKDLRNAVEAASKAASGWAGRSAFNRGQVLYRLAEMMESRSAELADSLERTAGAGKSAAAREVRATIDRCVYYAGWTDKYEQVIGNTNPVAGPYFTFSVPEPMGVIGVVAGDEAPLLGMVSQILPAVTSGNTVVTIGAEKHPLPAGIFGEIVAVSDFPGGVINVLTGLRADLLETLASHADVRGIDCLLLPEEAAAVERGAAAHIKRCKVRTGGGRLQDWISNDRESVYEIRDFVELKTVWHPYWV